MKPRKISFAAFCRDVIGEPISHAWDVAYKAFEGQLLKPEEVEIWRQLTGRQEYEPSSCHELTAVKGRRAQGTKTACKFLVYQIHTGDFRRYAARADRLHVPVIAQTRETAKEIMGYLHAFYSESDALRREVSETFKQSIELMNGFVISVQTCSYRAPRGITAPLALLDEVGVWRVEGADVDREVVKALTPAMVQFPTRRMILLGSPWTKSGLLFERFERRFESADRLVLHCPTPLMNPMIPAEELERERLADPQNYRREFLAEWLDDVDQFLPDSDISAAISTGIRERESAQILKGQYFAALDASGLTGKDAFTFAIGHRAVKGSGMGVAFDVLRGWSRKPVGQVCDEIANLLNLFGIRSITADQFGFAFLRELLAQRKIEVRQLPFTARSKPEVMLDLKSGLAQGRIQLLDHPESLRELRMLESTRTSGGSYSIKAPRGAHDDFACVIALLVHQAKNGSSNAGCSLIVWDRSGSTIIRSGEKPRVDDPRFWTRRGSL
jgi:hypothetical protein